MGQITAGNGISPGPKPRGSERPWIVVRDSWIGKAEDRGSGIGKAEDRGSGIGKAVEVFNSK